jgi:hypothetical protein
MLQRRKTRRETTDTAGVPVWCMRAPRCACAPVESEFLKRSSFAASEFRGAPFEKSAHAFLPVCGGKSLHEQVCFEGAGGE